MPALEPPRRWPWIISNREAVSGLAEYMKSNYGRVDILVNNAGVLSAGKLADADEAAFDRLFTVNV